MGMQEEREAGKRARRARPTGRLTGKPWGLSPSGKDGQAFCPLCCSSQGYPLARPPAASGLSPAIGWPPVALGLSHRTIRPGADNARNGVFALPLPVRLLAPPHLLAALPQLLPGRSNKVFPPLSVGGAPQLCCHQASETLGPPYLCCALSRPPGATPEGQVVPSNFRRGPRRRIVVGVGLDGKHF